MPLQCGTFAALFDRVAFEVQETETITSLTHFFDYVEGSMNELMNK